MMYEELYNAWKREKENVDLQSLPKGFYGRIAEYLKKIREESRMLDNKTLKARLMKRELENVQRLAQELVWLRHRKILEASAKGKAPPKEVLTTEEEKIQDRITPLAEFYQKLLESILRGQLSTSKFEDLKREKPQKMVIRFIKDIPAIIGADMKTYGPFKCEDVAALPIENAKILVKQGVAAEVEVEP